MIRNCKLKFCSTLVYSLQSLPDTSHFTSCFINVFSILGCGVFIIIFLLSTLLSGKLCIKNTCGYHYNSTIMQGSRGFSTQTQQICVTKNYVIGYRSLPFPSKKSSKKSLQKHNCKYTDFNYVLNLFTSAI